MRYTFIASTCLLASVSAAPIVDVRSPETQDITINGKICTPDSSGNYVVGTKTLVPGGAAITVDNTPISLFPSATAVLINGVATPLTSAHNPGTTSKAAPLTFHGATYTQNPSGNYIIGTQTLVPGGPAITVDNTPLSVFPHATAILISGVASPLRTSSTPIITPAPKAVSTDKNLPRLVFKGTTYTANSEDQFIVGGKTLSPGGAPVTIDNSCLSLFPSATAVKINGVATPLAVVQTQTNNQASIHRRNLPAITFDGGAFTANTDGNYHIFGQTLIPGGPAITVKKTPLSLFPSATAIMVNGHQTPLPATPVVTPTVKAQKPGAPFTFHGSVYKTDSHGDYLIGTQTLIPGGPAITIDKTPISLFPSATAVLIGCSPTPLGRH